MLAAIARLLLVMATPSAFAGATDDSLATLRHAQDAQRRFESLHRAALPQTTAGYGGGACDARIGGYCYWVDESDAAPPPDEPRVTDARRKLIALLDSLAPLQPGDVWIAAARVRYHADAGDTTGAIDAARACRHSAWCGALLGYALHIDGRHEDAARSFDRALDEFDERTRCAWLDITPLLDDEAAAAFARLDCAARRAFVRRTMWIATPLFARGAHELAAEYFARRTRVWIERNEASVRDDGSVSDALEELWIRYGWSRWYARAIPPVGSMLSESIIEHDAWPSFAVIPAARAIVSPFDAVPDDWADTRDRRARVRYAIPGLRALHPLSAQVARFRDGDSITVVAAYDATRDTSFHRDAALVALVVTSSPDEPRSDIAAALPRGTRSLTVPNDSAVVAVEVVSSRDGVAARWRRGVRPLEGSLSDLLLFAAPDDSAPPPPSRSVAIDHAIAGDTIAADSALGVYWEAYDSLAQSASRRVSVRVVPVGASVARRALWRLHIGAPPHATRVSWREPGSTRVAAGWIHFPRRAFRRGAYTVTIAISDGATTEARERAFVVR